MHTPLRRPVIPFSPSHPLLFDSSCGVEGMRKAAVTQGHAFVGARPSLRHFAFFLDTPWIEKAIEAPWPAPFLLLSPFPWPSHRAPHVLTHIPGKARAAVACPFGVGAQGPGLGTPRGATDLQTFYNPPRSVPSPCILPPPPRTVLAFVCARDECGVLPRPFRGLGVKGASCGGKPVKVVCKTSLGVGVSFHAALGTP